MRAESLAWSRDELLVRDASARSRLHEAIKPRKRAALHVAIVEPERELINVPGKVLGAGVMIDASESTFQHGPYRFDAVGADTAAHVLACDVAYGLMLESRFVDALVSAVIVRVERRSGSDVLVYLLLKARGIGARDRISYRAPVALAHPNYSNLADGSATSAQFLVSVLVLFLPSDIGFVHLDDAGKNGRVVPASFPESLQNEPCRLLCDADFLGQLQGRDTLARGHKQVHRVNPFVQRNVRALEDRPGAYREVLKTLIAAVVPLDLAGSHAVTKAANRAVRALGPKTGFEVFTPGSLVREHLEKLESADSEVVVHG